MDALREHLTHCHVPASVERARAGSISLLSVKEIIAAPATSLGGLRAKALVALWETYPTHASHEGTFEFRDDGSRSLFEAVAVMTGVSPLVRELEARFAADVE
jgi:hypothetical protein